MKVLSSTHAIAFANQDFATQFFAELVVFLLKCGLQNLFGCPELFWCSWSR